MLSSEYIANEADLKVCQEVSLFKRLLIRLPFLKAIVDHENILNRITKLRTRERIFYDYVAPNC